MLETSAVVVAELTGELVGPDLTEVGVAVFGAPVAAATADIVVEVNAGTPGAVIGDWGSVDSPVAAEVLGSAVCNEVSVAGSSVQPVSSTPASINAIGPRTRAVTMGPV